MNTFSKSKKGYYYWETVAIFFCFFDLHQFNFIETTKNFILLKLYDMLIVLF